PTFFEEPFFMINLTTAADVLNEVVVFFLWSALRKNVRPDQLGVRRVFSVLLLFFFVSSAPLAVFREPLGVGISLAFQHVLLMIAAGAIVAHVLTSLGVARAQRAFVPYVLLGASLTLAVLWNCKPIVWDLRGPIALFRADFPIWVRLVDAAVLVGSGLVAGLALLLKGGRAHRTVAFGLLAI